MPNKSNLNLLLSKDVKDLKNVRIPGSNKAFEELTIGELAQLRVGPEAASDSYDVTAFTDNVSVSTSSILNELGRVQKETVMKQEMLKAKIRGPIK